MCIRVGDDLCVVPTILQGCTVSSPERGGVKISDFDGGVTMRRRPLIFAVRQIYHIRKDISYCVSNISSDRRSDFINAEGVP